MLSKSFEQYKFNEFVKKAIVDLKFDNPTKIQERVFSPVLKGKNIVYIDTKKIEKLIKEDVRVKNVTIQKVFPSKLKINIEERKIRAYVKRGNDLYLADSDLNLFGYIQEKNKAPNLPIIIYTDDESMKDLKIIISKIKNKDLYDMIAEIRKSNKSYELVLLSKVRIITDTLVSEKKYDEIYKSYQKIKSDKTIQYIDIRFKYFNVK